MPYNNFNIGDKVELTPDMKLLATHPEKYGIGEVVGVGSWGLWMSSGAALAPPLVCAPMN